MGVPQSRVTRFGADEPLKELKDRWAQSSFGVSTSATTHSERGAEGAPGDARPVSEWDGSRAIASLLPIAHLDVSFPRSPPRTSLHREISGHLVTLSLSTRFDAVRRAGIWPSDDLRRVRRAGDSQPGWPSHCRVTVVTVAALAINHHVSHNADQTALWICDHRQKETRIHECEVAIRLEHANPEYLNIGHGSRHGFSSKGGRER